MQLNRRKSRPAAGPEVWTYCAGMYVHLLLSSWPPSATSPPVSSSNKLSFRTYTCPQKRSTDLEVWLRKRTTTLGTRTCGNLMVARVHCTITLTVGKGLRVHAYRAIAMYVTIHHPFCIHVDCRNYSFTHEGFIHFQFTTLCVSNYVHVCMVLPNVLWMVSLKLIQCFGDAHVPVSLVTDVTRFVFAYVRSHVKYVRAYVRTCVRAYARTYVRRTYDVVCISY